MGVRHLHPDLEGFRAGEKCSDNRLPRPSPSLPPLTQRTEAAPKPHLDLLVLKSTDLVFLSTLNHEIWPQYWGKIGGHRESSKRWKVIKAEHLIILQHVDRGVAVVAKSAESGIGMRKSKPHVLCLLSRWSTYLTAWAPDLSQQVEWPDQMCSLRSACVQAKPLQSCPALCSSKDCNLPGSSVHDILQARILEWVARPSRSCHIK